MQFDIVRVNSEVVGKIEKMRQAVQHVSEKNKASVEERIAAVEQKWSEVLVRLNDFNEGVRQRMKRDEVRCGLVRT